MSKADNARSNTVVPPQSHPSSSERAWERLETCLTNILLFAELYKAKTMWELTGYWHPLRERGRDMGASYTAAFAGWTAHPATVDDPYVAAQLGAFLSDNGLYLSADPS